VSLLEIRAMTIKVVLEPSEEGGFSAYVPSLPGCISEGETKEETLRNIKEAIELYLDLVVDDLSFAPGVDVAEVALRPRCPAWAMTRSSPPSNAMAGSLFDSVGVTFDYKNGRPRKCSRSSCPPIAPSSDQRLHTYSNRRV
jgi:predicted RNase H-like HicB family nuclease